MNSGEAKTPWRRAIIATATSLSVVLAALVAVTELGIAPAGVPTTEWFALTRDRALLLGVVAAVGVCAMTAGWNDLNGRRRTVTQTSVSGTTVAATLLAAGWAALPVALWSSHAWVRGSAFAAAAVIPVALAHLVHSALDARTAPPVTRLMPPVTRRAAWTAAYVLVFSTAVVHRLVADFFLDPRCHEYCEPGTLLLESAGLAQLTEVALRTLATVSAALVVVMTVVALDRGTSVAARLAGLAACLAGGVEMVWVLGPVSAPVVGPTPVEVPDLLAARLVSHIAVSISVIVLVVRDAQARLRLRRMAREIVAVTPPNTVRKVIALRLDDPGTRIEYVVEEEGVWVDEHGMHVADDGDPQHQVAVVSRDGRPVARFRFAADRAHAADLEDALGPAAVLALEAERTRAELLMRLSDLRDLRRRVVEESDAARRRAERDLHDGAQHLLLAATFAIQEGLQDARASGDAPATESLEHALADVTGIAADLRAVAHGMYPVLLGDAGLVAALEGLARSSAATVSIDADPVGRVDPSVELTLYEACTVAARTTVQDQQQAEGALSFALRRHQGTLRLTVAGESLPIAGLEPLRDRVAALGGRMESNAGSVVVEVPCA